VCLHSCSPVDIEISTDSHLNPERTTFRVMVCRLEYNLSILHLKYISIFDVYSRKSAKYYNNGLSSYRIYLTFQYCEHRIF
jgi:hypothetical protein